MNRPRWRWILFCIALNLSWHTGRDLAVRLMSWCIIPEWLGIIDGRYTASTGDGGEPW